MTTADERLEDIYSKWYNCTGCSLHKGRKEIVFGVGNPEADIVVIGTAPGKDEDEEGIPFVGESGFVQDELLREVGLSKDDIYCVNLVACRPYMRIKDFKTDQMRDEQRDPNRIEIATCRSLWEEIVYMVNPHLIVAYGNVVCGSVLTARGPKITQIQGELMETTIPGKLGPVRYPVMPMFQPAYLARNKDRSRGSYMTKAVQSWQRAVLFVDAINVMFYGTEPDKPRKFTKKDIFT